MSETNLKRVNRMLAPEDRQILREAVRRNLVASESEAIRAAIRLWGSHHGIAPVPA